MPTTRSATSEPEPTKQSLQELGLRIEGRFANQAKVIADGHAKVIFDSITAAEQRQQQSLAAAEERQKHQTDALVMQVKEMMLSSMQDFRRQMEEKSGGAATNGAGVIGDPKLQQRRVEEASRYSGHSGSQGQSAGPIPLEVGSPTGRKEGSEARGIDPEGESVRSDVSRNDIARFNSVPLLPQNSLNNFLGSFKIEIPKLSGSRSGNFKMWESDFLMAAKHFGVASVFQGTERVAVSNNSVSRWDLVRSGYSEHVIDTHTRAASMLRCAVTSQADLEVLMRCDSPTEAWCEIKRMYGYTTLSSMLEVFNQFFDYEFSRNENPEVVLARLEDTAATLRTFDLGIPPKFVLAQFLRILPSDYEHEVRTLRSTVTNHEDLVRERVMGPLRERYQQIHQKSKSKHKHSQFNRHNTGQAFIANGTQSGKHRNPGQGHWKNRPTYHKRGGNNSNDCKNQKVGAATVSAPTTPIKVLDVKCKFCQKTDHQSDKCPKCEICGGRGHKKGCDKLASDAVMASGFDLEPDSSDCASMDSAFVLGETPKIYRDGSFEGISELGWQAGDDVWIFDNGASQHVTNNSECMTNYRECRRYLRTAGGKFLPIEGEGDLILNFRTEGGIEPVLLRNVAHVPRLARDLFSLRMVADNGGSYHGHKQGVSVRLKSGRTLFAPSFGKLNFMYATRGTFEEADAVIAPGHVPEKTSHDINVFHARHAHAHEGLLRKTAQQLGITLTGTLQACQGCSRGKGFKTTHQVIYDNQSRSSR